MILTLNVYIRQTPGTILRNGAMTMMVIIRLYHRIYNIRNIHGMQQNKIYQTHLILVSTSPYIMDTEDVTDGAVSNLQI